MPVSTLKPLAQTIAAIEALDLDLIKFKATRREDGYGWSAQYADKMALEYKRYLILHAKYPSMVLAPDQDIDRFWHMHILDTRKYAADCDATFGHFVHHFPYLGLRGEEDAKALESAFSSMQQLYAQEFGAPLSGRGDTAAAWCGAEPADKNGAAWCGAESPSKANAAWCGAEVLSQAKAAWCGAESPSQAKAAWCGAEVLAQTQAAWCGAESAQTASREVKPASVSMPAEG